MAAPLPTPRRSLDTFWSARRQLAAADYSGQPLPADLALPPPPPHAALFAALDDGARDRAARESAADELVALCKAGNEDAVFGLCCRLVPSWSVGDSLASCEPLLGGMSGATVWKVRRVGVGTPEDTAVLRSLQSSTPVNSTVSAEDATRPPYWILPGKRNGVALAANTACAARSEHFCKIWIHELVQEFAAMVSTTACQRLFSAAFLTPISAVPQEFLSGGTLRAAGGRMGMVYALGEHDRAQATFIAGLRSSHRCC